MKLIKIDDMLGYQPHYFNFGDVRRLWAEYHDPDDWSCVIKAETNGGQVIDVFEYSGNKTPSEVLTDLVNKLNAEAKP